MAELKLGPPKDEHFQIRTAPILKHFTATVVRCTARGIPLPEGKPSFEPGLWVGRFGSSK